MSEKSSPPANLGLVSLSRAAQILDCHPVTLRRMVAKGQLRGYRLGPRMLRVEREQVEELIQTAVTAGGRHAS